MNALRKDELENYLPESLTSKLQSVERSAHCKFKFGSNIVADPLM